MRPLPFLAVAFVGAFAYARPHEGHHDEPSTSALVSTSIGHSLAQPTPAHVHTHPPLIDAHDHHHSHAKPLETLNETLILLSHEPDPPSYYDYDAGPDGRPGLIIAHIVFMSLAFFVFLPLLIFLKAARSRLATIPQVAFLASSLLGTFLGQLYSDLTPDRYEHNAHAPFGWITLLIVLALNVVDLARFASRLVAWFRGSRASLPFAEKLPAHEEHESLLRDGDDEDDNATVRYSEECASPASVSDAGRTWANASASATSHPASAHRSNSSTSDETLYDSAHSPRPNSPDDSLADVGTFRRSRLGLLLTFIERLLVLFGYVATITGIAVYSGSCRQNYINGCVAHLIKGSIFFWYGVLSFARYVGAFSEYGWAWNKLPRSHGANAWRNRVPSAEFVESFVIFLYGSTNTWMERFGKSGAYSVKDMQHISIAVMFWFAGLLGMLLESKRVRAFLSFPAIEASGRVTAHGIVEPASYAFSFNPFPALCIGITGIAMAAHHQTYVFQVEIHALWGALLAGFAVFRALTYFFLYLRPPAASILPSRPPTEALATFCLAAGGVVFCLSTEQVTFAAMRHHYDDGMAFLNVTVAFVCVVFTWVATLFGLKGWALERVVRGRSRNGGGVAGANEARSSETARRKLAPWRPPSGGSRSTKESAVV